MLLYIASSLKINTLIKKTGASIKKTNALANKYS